MEGQHMERAATSETTLVVKQLDYLAREIDDAHREVQFYAKGMLLEAKRAGEALLEAKAQVPHGAFKAWIEANTRVSYPSAAVYMKVAREWDQKSSTLDFSTASLRDFIGNKPSASTPAAFTRDDAEYVLKINALAERGIGGERDVARSKLETIAKSYGMADDELVKRSKELLPEPVSLSPLDAAVKNLMAPYERMSKPTLVAVLLKCFAAHPDLIDTIGKEFSV